MFVYFSVRVAFCSSFVVCGCLLLVGCSVLFVVCLLFVVCCCLLFVVVRCLVLVDCGLSLVAGGRCLLLVVPFPPLVCSPLSVGCRLLDGCCW